MTKAAPNTQQVMAWLVVVLIISFTVLGAVWHGFSAEAFQRLWKDLVERPGGPMTFRFILQPVMATIAALHDGVKDAKASRSPYFWTVLTDPNKRVGRLREGLFATSRIILLGLIVDVIYQTIVLNSFYPGEAVIVALALAFLPYLLLRGPIERVARWWLGDAERRRSL